MPYDALGNYIPGDDTPDVDTMRLAVAKQTPAPATPELRATPQSTLERFSGRVGSALESAGRFLEEPLKDLSKTHPIRSWLAKALVAGPLQGAGTALQDWSGTPRDSTDRIPYTPGPFYGGSRATLDPSTWGPALQTFKTDPRVLDVAGVAQPMGALAKATANKVVAPAARMAGEAMAQRMLSGESMIPGVPQAVAPSPLMFAVRPQGSTNWVPGFQSDSVDRTLARLKSAGPTNRDEALMWGGEEWKTMLDMPEGQHSLDVNAAVNRWVDKKLGTYIRNEMGTPEDPVRLAHEKGFTHIPGDPIGDYGSWLPEDVAAARVKAGYPEEGFAVKKHADAGYPEANQQNAYKGEMWENLADTEISANKASKYQDDLAAANWFKEHPSFPPNKSGKLAIKIGERNPWLSKVSPDTPVYHLNDPNGLGSNLGFDHLVDELRNTVDPASGLPQHLRWKPQDLDKVTMQQAVERVSKINDWRAEQAAKAEREGMMSNLTAAPRLDVPEAKLSFVEKPGMKWVDIPETTNDEGMKL